MILLSTRLDRCALRRGLAAACGMLALLVGAAAAFAQPTITDLPGLNPPYATPYAVSLGGSTVVGSSGGNSSEFPEQAWRWTSDGGGGVTEDLGYLPEPGPHRYYTRAYAVSADGSVVAGTSWAVVEITGYGRAFRWTPQSGIQSLGYGSAYAVSGDGSVVVGHANNFPAPLGACRWTSDGVAHVFDTSATTSPMGCNFDGSVVTGSLYDDSTA